ncbi:MAG TPA: TetR/AcrR family transcriptional regulator [Streptosporangiaceae bacterium]|nr:TetR/AcrR family transcriptional regulator [Streptosporangiaceae bacterium]
MSNNERGTRMAARSGSAAARTRGGWAPAGTAAARRVAHGERTTAKGLRTRDELVAAARRVFERDGYSGARVADIASAAGVAHGSFYTYFSSKQDAFLAVMRAVGAQFREAIAGPPGEVQGRGGRGEGGRGEGGREQSAYQALDASNRRYLDAYRENSVIWALAEQVATIDPEIHEIRLRGRRQHVERVAATIRRWQDRGIADPGIDPQTTAGALVSMLSNFAYWWLVGGDSYDPEAAAATLTDIWARAVGLRRPA